MKNRIAAAAVGAVLVTGAVTPSTAAASPTGFDRPKQSRAQRSAATGTQVARDAVGRSMREFITARETSSAAATHISMAIAEAIEQARAAGASPEEVAAAAKAAAEAATTPEYLSLLDNVKSAHENVTRAMTSYTIEKSLAQPDSPPAVTGSMWGGASPKSLTSVELS